MFELAWQAQLIEFWLNAFGWVAGLFSVLIVLLVVEDFYHTWKNQ